MFIRIVVGRSSTPDHKYARLIKIYLDRKIYRVYVVFASPFRSGTTRKLKTQCVITISPGTKMDSNPKPDCVNTAATTGTRGSLAIRLSGSTITAVIAMAAAAGCSTTVTSVSSFYG
jgi:hypothetical protein